MSQATEDIKTKALYTNVAAILSSMQLISIKDKNRARIERAVAKYLDFKNPKQRVVMLKAFLAATKVEHVHIAYVRGMYHHDAAMKLAARRSQIQPELISVSGKLGYIDLGNRFVNLQGLAG